MTSSLLETLSLSPVVLGTLSSSQAVSVAPSEFRGAIPQATSRLGLPKECCGIQCQAFVLGNARCK